MTEEQLKKWIDEAELRAPATKRDEYFAHLVADHIRAETCHHSIADARNPVVKSGYICVKCGTLFSAADHYVEMPSEKQVQKRDPLYVRKIFNDWRNP